MPLRFRCHYCGQKLRVGDDKVALRTNCPRCQHSLVVPSASTEPGELAAARPAVPPVEPPPEPPPLPGTAPPVGPLRQPVAPVADPVPPALAEIVIQEDAIEGNRSEAPARQGLVHAGGDRITVPRRVLYIQGILLGGVALLSFLLGFAVRGSRTAQQAAEELPQPCVVTGTVTYVVTGQDRPDSGSVAIAVPSDRQAPAHGKATVAGLRPGDPEPRADHANLRLIRSLGGDYARVDDEGVYRLRLSDQGEYYLLVISGRTRRTVEEPPEKREIAQMGRYFESPLDLLAEQRYRWTSLVVRRDLTLDVHF